MKSERDVKSGSKTLSRAVCKEKADLNGLDHEGNNVVVSL